MLHTAHSTVSDESYCRAGKMGGQSLVPEGVPVLAGSTSLCPGFCCNRWSCCGKGAGLQALHERIAHCLCDSTL